MEAVVRREIERVRSWRIAAAGFSTGERGREKYRQEFLQSLEAMEAIKDLINLLAREYGQGRFPELMAELRALLLDEGVSVFREEYRASMKQGVLREMDARILSSIMMSSLVGYHLANMYFGCEPGGVNREEFTEGLVELMMKQEGASS